MTTSYKRRVQTESKEDGALDIKHSDTCTLPFYFNPFIYTVTGVKCLCGGLKKPVVLILYCLSGSSDVIRCIRKLLKPVLWGVDSVALFISVKEQSESNPDCSFYSSIASFASGRSKR